MEKKIIFKNNQLKMSGILFLPANFNEKNKYPAIVISSPAGAVKEQSPSLYGKKLAQNNFIVLVFDTSHQGESEGLPRYLENPTERVEDIRSAIDYLTTLSFVDKEQIGALGICSGAGYSINTAMIERRIKAVVGVSTTDPGAWIREGLDGKITLKEQIKLLENVANERTAMANGSLPTYMPYVPNEVTNNMETTLKEAYEYYRTPRCFHPNSENKVLLISAALLIAFDCFNLADTLLTQPLLLIAGSKADTFYFSERIYNKVKKNKELFVIDGASHVDLYDKEKFVNSAIDKIVEFFSKNL
ncbi:alpha/beta hydrolase [Fusobacterium simiae]|uniref:Alpha/beta hydrolase n=1 Tax=Fusobacterium simiae TaxID=855 RepID=A0ABT4DLS1_FUSSI|nr:alpha/beta hydrolase [Fusobacterium simiae]MCY7008356.1 alpha/beta hydrolase [Fusobacterium simiae]